MNKVKSYAILIVIIFVIGSSFGCKGKSYIDQLADLEKKACACNDKTCADEAFKDYITIVENMKKNQAKISNEEGQKYGMSYAKIVQCLMKKGIPPLDIQKKLQELNK